MTSSRMVLGWTVVLALLGTLAAQAAAVPKELLEDLRKDGRVRVVAVLDAAETTSSVEARRTADRHAEVQERVLGELPYGTFIERYRYRYSPVIVVEVLDERALKALESSADVVSVHADAEGSGALFESRTMIRADRVQEELEVRGEGRIVAVLDSGVDTDHPDLAAAIVHEYHFLGGGSDVGTGAEDGNGHGTNVAGIVASRGTKAPLGIAPASAVIAVKVLDDSNRGFLSDWAAGVEHIVELVESGEFPVVDAINMSLVSDAKYETSCDDSYTAFASACRRANELGIALFASSGNEGSTTEIGSPSCFSAVFAVGSVLDSLPDTVSSFTSRNEVVALLAPGQFITSTGLGGRTSTYQGTSQASPHCAALACLMRQISPELEPAQVLRIAQETGVPVFDADTALTYPRIDALAALHAVLDTVGDCNSNGMPDALDIAAGRSRDCNDSLIPDECEIADGTSIDCDDNGVPDECEADCNGNGVVDACDIAEGTADDLDGDGVPDACGPVPFHRGDPNGDDSMDLSDAVFIFQFLFLGADAPGCTESADANNDFEIDLSDGISILSNLFVGGAALAAPGPPGMPCGVDPEPPGSAGHLGCEEYDGC